MSSGHYLFSAFVQRRNPKIETRPWWAVFARDRVVWHEQWERITFELTKEQGEALLAGLDPKPADPLGTPIGGIVAALLGKSMMWQLEWAPDPANVFRMQDARANFIPTSERK